LGYNIFIMRRKTGGRSDRANRAYRDIFAARYVQVDSDLVGIKRESARRYFEGTYSSSEPTPEAATSSSTRQDRR
jgi:hypothetical protein